MCWERQPRACGLSATYGRAFPRPHTPVLGLSTCTGVEFPVSDSPGAPLFFLSTCVSARNTLPAFCKSEPTCVGLESGLGPSTAAQKRGRATTQP